MPPPKIGERIKVWFRSWPLVGSLAAWIIDWQERREANREFILNIIVDSFKSGNVGRGLLAILYGAINEILGDIPFVGPTLQQAARKEAETMEEFDRDPSRYLASKLEELGGATATREIAESLGALVMDPVIGLFESYAGKENIDPHEFSRSFHGFMISLSWGGGVLQSIFNTVLGDRAPDVKNMLTQMYWSLGLGFLGWQTLAPLLSAGLQPNLERYYNRLYRPTRFNPAQMSDLFALGERSAPEMQAYLRDQGWLDADIESWIKLSYRQLPESGLWDLYDKGQITKGAMDVRLRGYGYDPAEIALLYKIHEKDDINEARNFSISTAKSAFKKGHIGVDEFRSILTELRYQPREIELLIQLLTTEKEEEDRELSTSQIRQLYDNRVVGKDETLHYLQQLRYAPDVAQKLVAAWDNEALPKPARINKSTILEAYTDGVLNRSQTLQMLQQEAGYSATQAEFLVKVEETERPKPVEAPGVKAASLALLADFVAAGMITRAELAEREEIRRYRPEDQQRIIELMYLQASTEEAG